MKTIPINEELNASSERLNKRLNDEFIHQQVERYKQEQAQKKQLEIEVASADKGGGAFRISDIWGVGSETWQGENVNEYIRKERDSWD